MKDYENIKIPVTSSVPFGLLKEFDEVIKGNTNKSNRSSVIVELMRLYVAKRKKNFEKSL